MTELLAGAATDPADLPAVVHSLTWEADEVVSVALRSADGGELSPWEPGAHVDLVLPNGLRRQYSLCGPRSDAGRYEVCVDRVADTRGGSEYVHLFLRPGQRVHIGTPRNHFALDPEEPAWLFLAGGIGITPFLPLVELARDTGTPWELHYTGRTRTRMAHLGRLARLRDDALGGPGGVTVYESATGQRPDVDRLVAALRAGAGVYVCGPERLLDACEEAVAARPDLSLHVERFRPRDRDLPAPRAFGIVARRSGVRATVPPERNALQVLEGLGVRVPFGCRTGLCGACEVPVVAGEVEHRDDVLTDRQRAAGTVMLPCVSRAVGSELVIDV